MTDFAVAGRTTAEYIRGALYGLAAVSIWSGWIVVARLGLKTNLTPWDIAALRFGVAGLLLLPYVVSKGLALKRLGWFGLVAIVLGGGAPVLLANTGLLFAPAAHAGDEWWDRNPRWRVPGLNRDCACRLRPTAWRDRNQAETRPHIRRRRNDRPAP